MKSKMAQFGALNNRKTVGQTHGERREIAKQVDTGTSLWQKTKDFFSGYSKKTNNIRDFANNADRYEGTYAHRFASNTAIERAARVYEGVTLQGRIKQPTNDKYVGFLDSVIQYLDARKTPKKA